VYGRSLRSTLDAISDEVVRSTGLAGAQIVLIDPSGLRMRVHGAAPVEAWPEQFTLLLEQARRRGAALDSLEAFRTRRPVVTRQRKAKLLADPAWEPLHQQLEGFEWDTFVSVPLLVRGQALGALNAYYRPGQDPDDDDVEFLTAMADQAALAVENARLLAESRDKAALDERHRLARELHDSACQQLFSLTLHIRAAQLALPGSGLGADNSIERSLRTIDQLAHAALEDMRALILELHPTLLHTQGLVAVVRDQAAAISSREGLQVRVEADDQRLEIDSDTELDAYRVIQEAIHNAVKHAKATSVSVRIQTEPTGDGTLILEVVDNGRGFDPSRTSGRLGLVSMQERAERMGGQLTISSRPGAGTTVRAVVPRVVGRRREDDRAGEI
jgi:signal transduction histidine kinase